MISKFGLQNISLINYLGLSVHIPSSRH